MESPSQNDLNERVRAVIAGVLGLNADAVPADAMAGEFAPWTSLAHIEIMMSIEAVFGVSVPAQLVADLVSVGLLADFLRRKGVS